MDPLGIPNHQISPEGAPAVRRGVQASPRHPGLPRGGPGGEPALVRGAQPHRRALHLLRGGRYVICPVREAVCNTAPFPCMSSVGDTPRPQRCPLQRPLRACPLLSPPRSSVSLFITLNTVLWVHE
jgi:hypothetical protein